MATDIVLDVGTYKTVLYSNGKILLEEPSAVAVDSDTWEPISFGTAAKQTLGRTPDSITTVFPIERGVISDYDAAESMIVHFIKSTFGNRVFKPRVIVVVPSGVTTVQHHSLANAVSAAGCRNISTIDNTIAAAVGLIGNIEKPRGTMIVDIGGGTTNISTMSMGGIARQDSLRIGSIDFDDAIEKYIRREMNILIGSQMAEVIKLTVGGAVKRNFDVTMTAKGRNLFTGLPVSFEITAFKVYDAIYDYLQQICKACQTVLEKTDPDIVADIAEDGIKLIGGGAKLWGMDTMLSDYMGISVEHIKSSTKGPLTGAEKVLKNPKLLKNTEFQFKSVTQLIVENDDVVV